MKVLSSPEDKMELAKALRQMSAALEMLDDLDAPGEVSSHLDLAISRLEQHLGLDSPPTTGARRLYASLSEELLATPVATSSKCPWDLDQSGTVP